jgi:hypothetical protein
LPQLLFKCAITAAQAEGRPIVERNLVVSRTVLRLLIALADVAAVDASR